MADFVQKTVNKTAVRDLSTPIASVTAFDNIIQTVIDDNPFGCVDYTGRDGQLVDGVVRNREHYTAKVFFEDANGKKVGNVPLQFPTIAPFEANAAAVLENAALATAMGGEAYRDPARETYYAQLKCHDPSGDDYYVTFTAKASGSHPIRTTPTGSRLRPGLRRPQYPAEERGNPLPPLQPRAARTRLIDPHSFSGERGSM